ncbi:hypothetical protein OESDEN_06909 [Oesophagostomum dentatum]|uniref:Uncharacterized protein n=1 Tax=Oesophagostomum dentatum TaxID=61180 RepID=A0A0B1TBK7_OESDE|nr:hypothetical protein OESDEN_06909 [Oesophagostomum dentatum]
MLLLVIFAVLYGIAQACSPQYPLADSQRSFNHLEFPVFTSWKYDESRVDEYQRLLEDMTPVPNRSKLFTLEGYIRSKGMPYARNALIQTPFNDRGYFANTYETEFAYNCDHLTVFLKDAKAWYRFVRALSVKCGDNEYMV